MANSRNTLNITSNSPYSAHVSVKIALTYGFLFIEKAAMSEITCFYFFIVSSNFSFMKKYFFSEVKFKNFSKCKNFT